MNRTLHLFIITFLVLTACTISPDKRFIGTWTETSRPGGIVTFKNDGTLTIGSNESTFIGTWEITKENLFNMLIVVDGKEIK
jgi:hypothetical protein